MNIYVGNIASDTTEDDLRKKFEEHGEVTSVNVIKDKYTGESRGFGFVEMENGEAAIDALNDSELNGRNLTVNKARPRSNSNSQGRGNFQGRGRNSGHGGGGGGSRRRY